jgi:PilZ domain
VDGKASPISDEEVAVANHAQISDRRTGARCSCNLTASCEPLKTGSADPFPGTVQNISENGIGLLLDREVTAGTCLWVVMRGADDVLLGKMMIRVVHASSQPDGHWLHGCLFTNETSEAELQATAKRSITDSGIQW